MMIMTKMVMMMLLRKATFLSKTPVIQIGSLQSSLFIIITVIIIIIFLLCVRLCLFISSFPPFQSVLHTYKPQQKKTEKNTRNFSLQS